MAAADLEQIWAMAQALRERAKDDGDTEREALADGCLAGITLALDTLGVPHGHTGTGRGGEAGWETLEIACDDDDLAHLIEAVGTGSGGGRLAVEAARRALQGRPAVPEPSNSDNGRKRN